MNELQADIKAFYITLLKESRDYIYLYNQIAIPLLSIEMQNIEINRKVSKEIKITFSSQLYYLNFKLNFYEPFIEQCHFIIAYHEDKSQCNEIDIIVDKVLNINFSVPFYDTFFALISNYKDETQVYEQIKNKQDIQYLDNQKDLQFNPSQYFIKNNTGEIIMYKTMMQQSFTELQPDEKYMLEFQQDSRQNKEEIQKQKSLMKIIEEDEDVDDDYIKDDYSRKQEFEEMMPVSPYRREKFRYGRAEAKKVSIQIITQNGQTKEKSSICELNLDSLTCQKFYLDKSKELYVICQSYLKNGQKILMIRSPMQITNNLQIPIEVQLFQNDLVMKQENNDNNQKYFDMFEEIPISYSFKIAKESSQIIPLKACTFQSVLIRPAYIDTNYSQKVKFEWAEMKNISLLQNEREIFEIKPMILSSKIIKDKKQNDFLSQRAKRNNQDDNANKIYFILNANVYSIRSFIDFNTQQTEFISLKYLTVNPPFTIQNLIPAPLAIFLKDNQNQTSNNSRGEKVHNLEMKMNSSIQLPYLDPKGNFDISLCIPGFEPSNYIPFKVQEEEDFALFEEEKQNNYIEAMEINQEEQQNQQNIPRNTSNESRFLKQKKFLFQLTSEFENQFNVCANVAIIQGFYHISFYSKYWFLNNTQMPLQIQIQTDQFAFDVLDLPFTNSDFDFNTLQKIIKDTTKVSSEEKVVERRMSEDSFQTVTIKDGRTYNKSVISQTCKKEQEFNYKEICSHLKEKNPFGYGRVKPWEQYKCSLDQEQGIIGALDINDIKESSSLQFLPEENNDELEEESKEQNINSFKLTKSIYKQMHNEEMEFQQQFDKQTRNSKTSLPNIYYQDQMRERNSNSLIHTPLTDFISFNPPLKDKDELQRIILFSDNPLEELFNQNQDFKIKICDSEWTKAPFEISKMQGETISIKDKQRELNQSKFDIVTTVQYLPYPFSASKLIRFQPKYFIMNKTFSLLYVIQSGCQEKGIFKIFPQETSNFHWTDVNKPDQICIKLEDYEYSGNFNIDKIGEINLRLKSQNDKETIIINISISEENNSYHILFSDISYAPPYRIENMTKTCFKICQINSRNEDFDLLRPYEIISFAWSYPLHEKQIKISLSSQDKEEQLGIYNIDNITKYDVKVLSDKKNKRKFLLQIVNEKTIKTIRIIYEQHSQIEKTLIQKQVEEDTIRNQKFKIYLRRFGVSIINSQAREIAYIMFKRLKLSYKQTSKEKRILLQAQDIQIDNQLVRQKDAIILKREYGQIMDFIKLKVQYNKSDPNENLLYYKKFEFTLVPFDLQLDGNFCDEMYKYILEIIQQSNKRFTAVDQEQNINEMEDPSDMKMMYNDNQQINIKKEILQSQKKIYIEYFNINEIKFNFSFQSSPILFREFTINPTLKFFIAMMSNLKNVQLKFNSYKIIEQHLLLSIFLAQLKKHYLQQCYSHKQFFKIVQSMEMFGNVMGTFTHLSIALQKLFSQPLKEKYLVVGVLKGGAYFIKHSSLALSSSVTSVLDTFRRAVVYITHKKNVEEIQDMMIDKDLFQDDIDQISKDINTYNSPLATIDTQNKIWQKIITRPKQYFEEKKKLLIKQKVLTSSSITEEGKQQSLKNFSRRKRSLYNYINLYSVFKFTSNSFNIVSKKFNQFTSEREELNPNKPQKIRPPRFVSFTAELEPYSYRKAYALQILNDINLTLFEAEIIHDFFTLTWDSLIFTKKRIICVHKSKATYNSASQYSHWNIQFRDIIRVSVEVFDQVQKTYIAREELEERINNAEIEQDIFLILRVFYHKAFKQEIEMDEEVIGDALIEKKRKQDRNSQIDDFSFSSIGDLRIEQKDLFAKYKDKQTVDEIYTKIYERIQNKNIN